jgi:hypothetical protein
MLKTFLLIVVGLSGDPEHGKTFHKWGATLAEASVARCARRTSVYLVDEPGEGDKNVTGARRARRSARRSNVREAGGSRGHSCSSR